VAAESPGASRRPLDRAFHRQLAVYSPVSWAGLARAAWHVLGVGKDPRPAVERLLREEYDANRVVLCASGTGALQLGLHLAKRAVGDSAMVALPGFTCYDVGTAAVGANARIVLYDLDPATLSPDIDSLERCLERGARVVVVSPLYGLPIDWEALEERAARYGALLIEDSAQGHGASWRGRRLGSLGRISVLSFGRGKGWSGGSGGALLVRGDVVTTCEPGRSLMFDEAAVLVRSLVQWSLGRPGLYGIPAAIPWLGLGETRYREPRPPARMTRTAAALLTAHHEASIREAAIRRRNAAALLEAIPAQPGIHGYRSQPDADPGYLRLPLRLVRGMAGFAHPREAVLSGIAPSYPSTLSALPAVRRRLIEEGDGAGLPGAKELTRTLVTLPTHSWIGEAERERLLRLLNDYDR
jgi:dTDP-4-amino-4,6-dideoxygalactose transaminase